MGYQTDFYGRLEFTRSLSENELATLDSILDAGRFGDPAGDTEVMCHAQAERAKRGGGPLVYQGSASAEIRAGARGMIVGDGLSAHCASALRITQDGRGLEYCSEKTYEMVDGVNFIVANARNAIQDFGLMGSLFADTEFEPGYWLVKIGADGWAHQKECGISALWRHSKREYLRRKVEWRMLSGWWRARQKLRVLATRLGRFQTTRGRGPAR